MTTARTDDEPHGELAWFRREVGWALWRPRTFARSLAREHYGVAGVLVALMAGFALSLSVDDRTRGLYEWRPLLLRQLTAVSGSQAMSLVFRFIEPADEQALLAESSSIAAGWRLAAER